MPQYALVNWRVFCLPPFLCVFPTPTHIHLRVFIHIPLGQKTWLHKTHHSDQVFTCLLKVGEDSSSSHQRTHGNIGGLFRASSILGLVGGGSGGLAGCAGERRAELGDFAAVRGLGVTGGGGLGAAEGAEEGASLGGDAGNDLGRVGAEDGVNGAVDGAALGEALVDVGVDAGDKG